jgi:phosphoribosylformylglycinamidine cyclo-ligase
MLFIGYSLNIFKLTIRTIFMTSYAESGVNNEEKERISRILYEAAKKTWNNRQGMIGEIIVPFDDFSGLRCIDVSRLPEGTLMGMGLDGAATKIEIAERTSNHRTVAKDLFAMVCDDAIVRGAEPVIVGSILDTNSLILKNKRVAVKEIQDIAEGYIEAAKEAGVAVINGETAELGTRVSGYGDFNYNWGAAAVWFAKKERMLTGNKIKPGDSLVALREDGFRANGISLLRKILLNNYGEDWHKQKLLDFDETLGELALTPSKIYTRAVVSMFGGYADDSKVEIHGIAHITGGGIPEKVKRMLKSSGLGAELYSLFSPSKFMFFVQGIGEVSDFEAYKTWNMGQGMIIATPEPQNVMKIAIVNYGIDAKIVGEVSKNPCIRIISRGFFDRDKALEF